MIHKHLITAAIAACASFFTASGEELSKWVDTGIGAGGYGLVAGNCYRGAVYPHGMVQFTPAFFSRSIGFTVNQMMGVGCPHMGNFPLLPLKGALSMSPDDMVSCRIQITGEKGHAGFYEATVQDDIRASLTATPRTGFAEFVFPENEKQGTVIIGAGISSTPIENAAVVITGPHSAEGYAEGGNFCGYPTPYKVYFAAEFSEDAVISGTWKDEALHEGATFAEGRNSGIYFTFNTSDGGKLYYKFAVSYVSVENAKENLMAENPGWDFAGVRQDAERAWDEKLSKILVETDDTILKKQFYSHLYHVFSIPSLCSDVNGDYMGADFKVHKTRFNQYTAFSNWDTYRTQIQLISMLEPDVASDIVVSHQDFAEQSGGSFPRWVVANIETGIMQGDPTSILISNAYAFGARNYDAKAILRIMTKGATEPGSRSQAIETRPGLKQYLEKGYYNASEQLEYTSADFAIGQFALKAAGDEFASFRFFEQARSWKNLFNSETGWLQSRDENGDWKPLSEDFREATYKNYFWMVPYDFAGLFELIGGPQEAEKRLDEYTVRLDASYWDEWFACGNEPTFHNPWIYNWTGSPYKTQALVNRIITEQYSPRPDGFPGNEDAGTMGAWYVFSCIGLYPVIPGVGGFSINTPIFPSVTVRLKGGDLIIKGGSGSNIYITSMKLDGKACDSTWIDWEDVENGALIEFRTSSRPSAKWGTSVAPPSFR